MNVIPAVVAVLRGVLWLAAVGGVALIAFLVGRMLEGWRIQR